MTPSQLSLFSLLKTALSGVVPETIPADVNWPEVFRLSVSQGVGAIAFDGLQRMISDNPSDESLKSLGHEKYQWMMQKIGWEQDSEKRKKVIASLAELWQSHGLELYALKGLAFAHYYPVPEHRQFGDFDFYASYSASAETDGTPAWRKADSLLAEKGIDVDDSMSKHSKCVVGGLSLENHRHLIGVKGSRQWKANNDFLKSLLNVETCTESDIPGLLYPCWLFNALFCLIHARTHFLIEEGITLRQICDWEMIRRHPDAEAHWSDFQTAIDKLGLRKFYSAFDGVTDFVFGKKKELSEPESLMMDDIMSDKDIKRHSSLFAAHLGMVGQILSNRWKFRRYSDAPMTVVLGRYLIGYIFEKDYE